MPKQICIDYETRSESDLRKVGAVTYAQDVSTEVICLGYKIDNKPTKIWIPKTPFPQDLRDALKNPNTLILSHNAFFEINITTFVLSKYIKNLPKIPLTRWRCSAAKAAAVALPRDLAGAGAVLRLATQKDKEGHRLMLKHSKPRPHWKKHGTGDKYFEDPKERARIHHYCLKDVDTEVLLDQSIPDLIPFEQQIWCIVQEMNLRGVLIDIPTVKRIWDWTTKETIRLNAELAEITCGKVTTANQRDKFIYWLRKHQGVALPNLQGETVNKLLEMKLTPEARRALEIRQGVGKASLKKYPAMLKRVSKDNRVKDYEMYHGASTGRGSGRGLQLQNLVKGKVKNPELAIELINNSTLDEIRFLYGDVFEVFSSCVRSMIIASPGHKLTVADYNAIEARVLHWMAGDRPALKRWLKGIDAYKKIASEIYRKLADEITADERDVGKRAELGCGFGMGAKKFYATCLKYGAKNVTEQLCKRAVDVYRKTHPAVVSMWTDIERAAINATKNKGKIYKACRTEWQWKDRFLWCRLPSGRKLAYYGATVRWEPTPWGEDAPKLYHWSVNPKTHKWTNDATYGGKLTENVVQATARDILFSRLPKLKKAGYMPLFGVHDEFISETKTGNVTEYEKILATLPDWAKGLPVIAKGWEGKRYAKR